MGDVIRTCEHQQAIFDYREGIEVCLNCGLILSDKVYLPDFLHQDNRSNRLNYEANKKTHFEILNLIETLLDRMHISLIYVEEIFDFLLSNGDILNEATVMFAIYSVLNTKGVSITMRELSNVSTLSPKQIHRVQKCNQNIALDIHSIMEKYAALLNLSFPVVMKIKEKITLAPASGHNPNSLIAAAIYTVCKECKLGISMKKISTVMQISCISIQRYKKLLN